jgi:hypothetical protein
VVAVLASFVLVLPVQFAGVGGYFAVRAWFLSRRLPRPRRRLAGYERASRVLGRGAAFCAPVSGVILAVGAITGRVWPSFDSYEILFAIAASATVSGAWLSLQAGRDEAHGRLRRSCAGIRLGGRTMCGGIAAELALGLLRRITEFRIDSVETVGSWPDARGVAETTAWGLIFLGGSVALLAALTGKPRPSTMFAVLLYAAGRIGTALIAEQWQ